VRLAVENKTCIFVGGDVLTHMAADPQFSMEKVLAEIRASTEARRARGEVVQRESRKPKTPSVAFSRPAVRNLGRLRAEVMAASLSHNAVGAINPRRGGPVNASIQFVKRAMRRSLTWYTRPLHQFHGAVARSLQEILEFLDNIQAGLETVSDRVGRVEAGLDDGASRLEAFETQIRDLERHVRHLNHLAEKAALVADASSPGGPSLQSGVASEAQFDYFGFEQQFRGPEDAIRERQIAYADCFRNASKVADLGCGRGEFLEVLRERGISAVGVESGTDAFLRCKDKGLEVVQQDLFTYLESVEDESLGGIFSSQVIEHMPATLQLRMVNLAHRKLAPGAYLVIETINPESLYALSRNFLLDPTHVRPMHPETLAFVMRSLKFSDVELKFSSPAPGWPMPKLKMEHPTAELDDFNETLERMNTALFGNQDYAAIGQK
jgi:SAM-dependent methyltransferase